MVDGVQAGVRNEDEFARAAARARLERLSRLLDTAFRIPGTSFRFGLDGILGLVPGVGDAAGSLLALWVVYEGYRMGLPRAAIVKMLANVGLDFAVGSIPVVGDIFDIAFKASTRNVRIARRYLDNGPS